MNDYQIGDVVDQGPGSTWSFLITGIHANGKFELLARLPGGEILRDTAVPGCFKRVIVPANGAPLRYCIWRFEEGRIGDTVKVPSLGPEVTAVVLGCSLYTCNVQIGAVGDAVMVSYWLIWSQVGDLVRQCAECPAELRPDQVTMVHGKPHCSYCAQRRGEWPTGISISAAHDRLRCTFEPLDARIAAAKPAPPPEKPRKPYDWDVDMLDYES